jgi:hypothetical protein
MRGLWLWFLARSLPSKIVLGLVVLALAAFLSPILSLLAILALIVSLVVLLIRLLRGRPLRNWGLAAVAPFALIFVFSGVSNAVYGPPPPHEKRLRLRRSPKSHRPRPQQNKLRSQTKPRANAKKQSKLSRSPNRSRNPDPNPSRSSNQSPNPRRSHRMTAKTDPLASTRRPQCRRWWTATPSRSSPQ